MNTLDFLWNYEQKLTHYHYYQMKPQFEVAVDQSDMWRALAVEEGHFHYDIGGKQGVANDGHFVICPPDTPFKRVTKKPISFHFFVFYLETTASDSVPADPIYLNQVVLSYRNQRRLFSSLNLLSSSSHLPKDQQTLKWRNHLLQDLLLSYAQEQTERRVEGNEDIEDPLISKANTMLEQQLDQPFFVQELADQVGLSPVQFTRRFRHVYGMNPSEYISNLRLKKASQLLIQTDLSIEDIAIQCGYSNGFYFSRVFRLKKDMSPSQFRHLHRI